MIIASLVFDLEADQVYLDVADVFDAVGREAIQPSCRRQRCYETPAVEEDRSLAIAADEMAEGDGVVDAGPAMRVDGNRIAYRDAGVEDADPIVFEDKCMVL